MLSQEQIESLEAVDTRGARVLSAYLDLDPALQVRRMARVVFEDLVKAAREPLPEPTADELTRESTRVQAWLDTQARRGKGVAVFSCDPAGLWQVHVLHVRVQDHLTFEPTPDVAPLLELMDEYERYAVALVDKERARLFTVFMGEIEETDALADLVPGKHDQGGLSQTHYQRHHEVHVHWHLKGVAQRLAQLFRLHRFDRLILAGPEEATSGLRRLLPRVLAQRLVAVVPGKLAASDAQILEQTLEIERGVERQVEERLLAELIDQAGPAGPATLGVRPTLDALWADTVQTLVVAHRDAVAGSECPNCERLDAGRVAACPACGTAMQPVHDLFHRAMQHARAQAASVEVVHGAAARRLLDAGAGLGAFLRYRWAAA